MNGHIFGGHYRAASSRKPASQNHLRHNVQCKCSYYCCAITVVIVISITVVAAGTPNVVMVTTSTGFAAAAVVFSNKNRFQTKLVKNDLQKKASTKESSSFFQILTRLSICLHGLSCLFIRV